MGGKKGGVLGSVSSGATGLGKLIFGKKDPGIADRFIPLDPIQEKALGQYGNMLNTNTDGLAGKMIADQERMIRTGAQDAVRKTNQLMAQRGLKNSSLGLGAITGITRDMGDKIGEVRSRLPGLQYDLKTQNLNNATNGLQNILNSRTFIQGTPGGQRTGGLAPLIGAGIGGAYGGAGGAQAGLGIGKVLTQLG